jgi:hypothetical protein
LTVRIHAEIARTQIAGVREIAFFPATSGGG